MGVEGAIIVKLGRSERVRGKCGRSERVRGKCGTSEGVRGKCGRSRINSCSLKVVKRGERGRVRRVRGFKWEGRILSRREEGRRVHRGRATPPVWGQGEAVHTHTPRVRGKYSCRVVERGRVRRVRRFKWEGCRVVEFRKLWKITKSSWVCCLLMQ